ncbi:hypothetical protein L7F22_009315 [Adiantum nelumboides]|nr:hypothetical protein [Adiantum nelumboides]
MLPFPQPDQRHTQELLDAHIRRRHSNSKAYADPGSQAGHQEGIKLALQSRYDRDRAKMGSAGYHSDRAQHHISVGMWEGGDLMSLAKASLMLTTKRYGCGEIFDAWMSASLGTRLSVSLAINRSNPTSPDMARFTGKTPVDTIRLAMSGAPADWIEEEERRRLMFLILATDRSACASTLWANSLDDSDVTVELPRLSNYDFIEGNTVALATAPRQTLQSRNLFTEHHIDGFNTMLKACVLMGRIGTFLSRLPAFATSEDMMGSPAFHKLDNTLSSFSMSLPFRATDPDERGQIDVFRFATYAVLHTNALLLHSPLLRLNKQSAAMCEAACHSVLDLLRILIAAGIEFARLPPLIILCLGTAGRVLVRRLQIHRGQSALSMDTSSTASTTHVNAAAAKNGVVGEFDDAHESMYASMASRIDRFNMAMQPAGQYAWSYTPVPSNGEGLAAATAALGGVAMSEREETLRSEIDLVFTYLCRMGNSWPMATRQAQSLAQMLGINTSDPVALRHGGNTLGVGACQGLGKVLKEKKTLKIAGFADIFTGRLITEIPDALRALCDSLVDHESLVELDLSDNAFGGRSAEPMVNFLTNNHHFSVLKLNNNGLGVTGGKIVADALLAAGEELAKQNKPSKLTTVICGRNRLEDGSAPHWAKAFASHKTLEEVRMFQNGIRMDGIVAIAQGLAACKQLKVLDLQDNTATVSGSRGIAAALPHWQDLETLNLSDCLLKPKGGYLVLDVLHKGSNKKLNTLQLQYCDLDRKALAHLASAIDSGALANIEKLEINGTKETVEEQMQNLSVKEEKTEASKDSASPSEVAAAAVAAPAATAAVIGQAASNAASNTKDAVKESLQGDSSANAEKSNEQEKAQTIAEVEEAEKVVKDTDADEQTSSQPPPLLGETDKINLVGSVPQAPKEESKGNEEEKAQTIAEVEEAEKVVKDTDADEQTSSQPPPLLGETDKTTLPGSVPQKSTSEAPKDESHGTLAAVGGGAALAGLAGAAVAGVTGKEDSTEQKSKAVERTEKAVDTPTQTNNQAETAAEVAESAQEVPEEKEAAKVAAEVAESAKEVPDQKAAAETADEVDEVAKQVPEKTSGQATPVVSQQIETKAALPAAPIADAQPISGHGKQSSVDLSGELYGNQNAAPAGSSGPSVQSGANPSTSQEDEAKPKKKSGFRAAFGAIRELLK